MGCRLRPDATDRTSRRRSAEGWRRRVHPYLRKGSEVTVKGWLRAREGVNHHGEPMRVVEVVAEEVEFIRNINWEQGEAAAAGVADAVVTEQED